jgi:hypothetical protein
MFIERHLPVFFFSRFGESKESMFKDQLHAKINFLANKISFATYVKKLLQTQIITFSMVATKLLVIIQQGIIS